jgi:hypothetical protein
MSEVIEDIDTIIKYRGQSSNLLRSMEKELLKINKLDYFIINDGATNTTSLTYDEVVHDKIYNGVETFIPRVYLSNIYKSDRGCLILTYMLFLSMNLEFSNYIKELCPKYIYKFIFLLDLCRKIKVNKLHKGQIECILSYLRFSKKKIIERFGKIGYLILRYSTGEELKFIEMGLEGARGFMIMFEEQIKTILESNDEIEVFENCSEYFHGNREFRSRIAENFT